MIVFAILWLTGTGILCFLSMGLGFRAGYTKCGDDMLSIIDREIQRRNLNQTKTQHD